MGHWPDKYVIGLTGNLAMGKSLVRRMLEHLGAYTIDAGGLAYQAMAPGAPAYKPVIQTFGTWVLDAENRVDRARLAAVAFSHPEALTRQQALTQPIVSRAIDTLIGRARHNVVVLEAVDLLEGEFADKVDAVWVVNCSAENQVARLVKSGLSEWEARKRINLQNPQQAKLDRATVVIQNDGSPEHAWVVVQEAWHKLGEQIGRAKEAEAEAKTIAVEQPAASGLMEVKEIRILRGAPKNAEEIAGLITELSGKPVSRMDVMYAFGQKSYLIAQADGRNVGLVGFQVENLITRVDEFLLKREAMLPAVIAGLVEEVEASSKELQSEIGFFFLAPDLPEAALEVFAGLGYMGQTLELIKVPAWREAARESQPAGTVIYAKKLREDRVLKPL